jgi:hypothetical protein
MSNITREHWEQAAAFLNWIDKQDDIDTGTTALLKPHFRFWANGKEFEKEDRQTIWRIVLLKRRQFRTARIPKRNKERLERIRGKHTYGPYHQWMSTLQCILAVYPDHKCMKYADGTWVKGHHVLPVGRGGQDWRNEVPVCNLAHGLCHTHWNKIEESYGISLRELGEKIAEDVPDSVMEPLWNEEMERLQDLEGDDRDEQLS